MSLIDLASMVLAPTAVKDGKVYNAIPNDQDFAFSRGTEATRVNSAGLIEKARTNLLLQSNTFNTTWSAVNASVTGGQSGYDGSSDAWLLSKSGAGGRIQQTLTTSAVNTFSVYAKAGTNNWLATAHPTSVAYFNLSSGTVGNIIGSIEAKIEDVGNGWYRCIVVHNTSTTNMQIYVADGNGDVNGTSGNILIQDAQLEQGLVATDYIETTTSSVTVGITDDLPRVDYSGGGCPSLLLEGQRTNVVTNSEYIASITDLTNGDGTISSTSNYAISPEGVKNATRIQASATGTNYALKSYTPTSSVSGNYTCSMYIKSNTSLNQSINFYARGGNNVITVTPEWQRFVVVGVGSTNFVNFGITQASGQENIDILCYGLQMEQDVTYPTSYLPTYGTSTTRVQDSCSKTGISELIGQTEGTMFLNLLAIESEGSEFYQASFSDGSNNETAIFGFTNTSGQLRFRLENGGVAQCQIYANSIDTSTYVKAAIAYKANDFVFYVNGVQAGTDTSGSVPSSLTQFQFANGANTSTQMYGNIKEVVFFPTRLTNDQLEELTK